MEVNDFKNLNFSLLGHNTSFEGDLQFEGDTIINGHIKGSITLLKKGKITFERDSKMLGELYCHDVEILGSFEGSIKASGTLIVRSSGQVSGKIEAQKLSIYPGAVMNIDAQTNPTDIE